MCTRRRGAQDLSVKEDVREPQPAFLGHLCANFWCGLGDSWAWMEGGTAASEHGRPGTKAKLDEGMLTAFGRKERKIPAGQVVPCVPPEEASALLT